MNIVFVCTGNTCRSPMAEAIAKFIVKNKNINNIKITSAGIKVTNSYPININAKKALNEIGVFLENHISKLLDQKIIDNSDKIITMTKNHKKFIISKFGIDNKVFTLSEIAENIFIDVEDPYMCDFNKYVECRKILEKFIKKIKWEEL